MFSYAPVEKKVRQASMDRASRRTKRKVSLSYCKLHEKKKIIGLLIKVKRRKLLVSRSFLNESGHTKQASTQMMKFRCECLERYK